LRVKAVGILVIVGHDRAYASIELASGIRAALSRGKAKRDTEDAGDQQDRIEEEKVNPDVDLGCEDLEGELPQWVGEPDDSCHQHDGAT
jgi:hypothetical protein